MAAHRKRPIPPTRMVDLLVEAKRELLAQGVELTPRVFERAWAQAWEVMIAERAWPHATEHRRQWRSAMIATKSEARAAFLDRPTMFARMAESFMAAGSRLEVDMRVSDLPLAFQGAIRAYGATLPEEAPSDGLEAMTA